jgi:hypothetical protein
MSRDASIELEFGGESRLFRTNISAWEKIQDKCDAGPEELLRRYVTGTWRVHDVREVYRQGLVWATRPPTDVVKVDRLLKAEFDDLPILQFVKGAQAITMAFLIGAPDEDEPPREGASGEPEAGEAPPLSPAES